MILKKWYCDDCHRDFYLDGGELDQQVGCPYCGTGSVHLNEEWNIFPNADQLPVTPHEKLSPWEKAWRLHHAEAIRRRQALKPKPRKFPES